MRNLRLLQLFALLVALTLLMSACVQTAPPAATKAPVATEAPPATEAPAPAAAEKQLIAGVVFQSDTFMQTVQSGMQARADESGVELLLGVYHCTEILEKKDILGTGEDTANIRYSSQSISGIEIKDR